ncbi:hypothetical protein RJB92_01450 [Staphylococcus hominis]|uniref:hypothetical protein n=1 Tax=Staphylococcus hominis TaxID=1290 RepID=UPI0028796A36|nr:hypothetical protein [Staphylococcus hominis]MDS3866900.1 hypothetical protein [Staphylococcus hominis]
MCKEKSNKEQIEWENNGGVSPGEGEYRNQESGDKSITKKDIEKAMKEKGKN